MNNVSSINYEEILQLDFNARKKRSKIYIAINGLGLAMIRNHKTVIHITHFK